VGTSLPLLSHRRRRLLDARNEMGTHRRAIAVFSCRRRGSASTETSPCATYRRREKDSSIGFLLMCTWLCLFFFSSHAHVGWDGFFLLVAGSFFSFFSNAPVGLITSSAFLLAQPKVV
jgi:hypothetical protein